MRRAALVRRLGGLERDRRNKHARPLRRLEDVDVVREADVCRQDRLDDRAARRLEEGTALHVLVPPADRGELPEQLGGRVGIELHDDPVTVGSGEEVAVQPHREPAVETPLVPLGLRHRAQTGCERLEVDRVVCCGRTVLVHVMDQRMHVWAQVQRVRDGVDGDPVEELVVLTQAEHRMRVSERELERCKPGGRVHRPDPAFVGAHVSAPQQAVVRVPDDRVDPDRIAVAIGNGHATEIGGGQVGAEDLRERIGDALVHAGVQDIGPVERHTDPAVAALRCGTIDVGEQIARGRLRRERGEPDQEAREQCDRRKLRHRVPDARGSHPHPSSYVATRSPGGKHRAEVQYSTIGPTSERRDPDRTTASDPTP